MYFLSRRKPLQSVSISLGSFGREEEEDERDIWRKTARPESGLNWIQWRWACRGNSTKVSANAEAGNGNLKPLTVFSCHSSLETDLRPNPPTAWDLRLGGYKHFHRWHQGGKGVQKALQRRKEQTLKYCSLWYYKTLHRSCISVYARMLLAVHLSLPKASRFLCCQGLLQT